MRSLDKSAFQALVDEDVAYHTIVKALVDETEATRRKREVAMTQTGGGDRGARQVAFVQANKSRAKYTLQARRGINDRRQEFVNEYTFLKLLGAGTYGRVHLCSDSVTGRIYAIKVVDKAKLRRKRLGLTDQELLREVEVMKKLRHRKCVKFRLFILIAVRCNLCIAYTLPAVCVAFFFIGVQSG